VGIRATVKAPWAAVTGEVFLIRMPQETIRWFVTFAASEAELLVIAAF
jgi:hypothetical protein